jgi:hypothetical protein
MKTTVIWLLSLAIVIACGMAYQLDATNGEPTEALVSADLQDALADAAAAHAAIRIASRGPKP